MRCSRCNSVTLWLALGAFAPVLAATGSDLSDYTVAQLLEPCVEGDNDSRWGAAAEAECEQYVTGFTDAYLMLSGDDKQREVCLPPPGNRADEVRWAFVKWVHRNFERRNISAAEGLLETLKAEFSCR